MREEIHKENHEMTSCKVSTNIVLWWAGTFLGKRLHDMMSEKLSQCTFDSELSLLTKVQNKV